MAIGLSDDYPGDDPVVDPGSHRADKRSEIGVIMLQKPKDLAEMIIMDLRHHCAEDPETGAYLIRSDGRRKAGRARKYWYRAPGMINAKVIYAATDEEALSQINGDL